MPDGHEPVATAAEGGRSYRRLFAVDGFPRFVASMLLARLAGQMVALVLVLFVLQRYASPELAGFATFLSIAPGVVVSPVAGALLDRHGRTRLVVMDYLVAAAALGLIAALAMADRLPVPLFLGIVAVASLTQPLSNTGVRTLFPLLVPPPLWERANAIDSNGYVVSSIFGPALAGALVAALGAEAALAATGAAFGAAALATVGLKDPGARTSGGRLLRDAWAGVRYVVANPTLRGLAAVVSTWNVAQGLFFLALPVLVLQRLGQGPAVVGQLFALLGVSAFISVLLFGRMATEDRERALFVGSILGSVAAFVLMLFATELATVALGMLILGVATGPFDIALFTLRQRRTDPAWLGRAFAVSMYLNYAGFPVGSALGGILAGASVAAALAAAIAIGVFTALITPRMIPRRTGDA